MIRGRPARLAARADRSTQGRTIMRQAALSLAIVGLAWPFLAAAPAQAQSARTWVSGAGDDTSPTCSRTAPCKTFSVANSRTTPGGEINCLDAGQFGAVTITFSVTISCQAGTAGVLASSFNSTGIYINAATTDVVTLRGLDIDGQGNGGDGIGIQSAKAVHVEKCTVRNFRGGAGNRGIVIYAFSFTVFLFVTD